MRSLWYGLINCKKTGIETTVIINPRTNFHNLIPTKKRMKTPNISMLNDVPKSGCITTKINGITKIKKGKNK